MVGQLSGHFLKNTPLAVIKILAPYSSRAGMRLSAGDESFEVRIDGTASGGAASMMFAAMAAAYPKSEGS